MIGRLKFRISFPGTFGDGCIGVLGDLDDEFDFCSVCGEHAFWIANMWCVCCGAGLGRQHPLQLLP